MWGWLASAVPVIGFQSSCGSVINLTPALELGMAAGQPFQAIHNLQGLLEVSGCSELICKRTGSSLDREGGAVTVTSTLHSPLEASGRGTSLHNSSNLFLSDSLLRRNNYCIGDTRAD